MARSAFPVTRFARTILRALPGPAWLRHSLPVVGVVAVLTLVSAIAYYIYSSNRQGAIVLSNDLITAIDSRVAIQMHAYFQPAQQFLELAEAAANDRPVDEGAAEAERFALQGLPGVPAITGFSYADPAGDFLFVMRNQKGGLDTKRIDVDGGNRKVTWTRRDAGGSVTSVEDDPGDTFDPRKRPWYLGAEEAKKPFWTSTYLFFTAQKPGISFAIPSFHPDGRLRSVVSVDIEIATICAFLKELGIGVSGKALIVDREGRVVAYPSDHWLPADRPDIAPPKLDELGDPVLTHVYNRLRVEGYGRKILEIGDRRIIVSSEPVNMLTGRDWVTLIVVPETDFVGFVSNSGIAALIMSLVVVFIVAVLSGLMAWRSMQADRRASAAATRQQALEVRTQTFIELARGVGATGGIAADDMQAVTERAANACAAKRVAVWRLTSDRRTLLCEDCFDRVANDHTSGLTFHRDEMPNLFATLDKAVAVDTADAGRDRRTSELFASYLAPLEIKSVYLAPIVAGGRSIGVLTVEDPRRSDHAAGLEAFCDALSILLGLRFTAATSEPTTADTAPTAASKAAVEPSPTEERALDSFAQREARLERSMLQQGAALEHVREASIDRAAVGVVKLPPWTTVAQRPHDSGERTAMDAIVHELRRLIERSGVTYATLLDDEIVLAAFSTDGGKIAEDARCIATTILALRDRLIEFEDRWSITLDFRLAIDVGTVMASTVGTEPPTRNLWGGALTVAKVLATTASRRSIAASETTYDILAGDFLFRPRGSYFLPETGTMRTFVMVGRT